MTLAGAGYLSGVFGAAGGYARPEKAIPGAVGDHARPEEA